MGLILYDAKHNYKKTVESIEHVRGMSGQSTDKILECKKNIEKIPRIKCYLLNEEDATLALRKELYAKEVYKDEAWKDVEGSGGAYKVSSYGRFKRVSKTNPDGRYLLPFYANRRGKYNYEDKRPLIKLRFKDQYNDYYAARIVAYHFAIYMMKLKIKDIGNTLQMILIN